MDRPELKLVKGPQERRRTPAAAWLGAAVLGAAVLATARGADASRRPVDVASLAESSLARTLATKDPAPAREALERLRRHLARTPLDSASRTIAASLMVETADTDAERAAAAEQAQAATRLVATDEWIAHGAARVLARCGRHEAALKEVERMFAYAPDEAAATLADVEPFVASARLEDGLPPTAAAWLSWSTRLRMTGREKEADERLANLLARWPNDLASLAEAASVAAAHDRTQDLVRLIPPSRTLPDTPGAARLFAFRARSKAETGDPAGAATDALHAAELAPGDPWVPVLAGDALASIDPELARDFWNRALYRFLADETTREGARWVRARLARLDERQGRAGDALRGWREILAEHPDDDEAQRRIQDLTGAGAP